MSDSSTPTSQHEVLKRALIELRDLRARLTTAERIKSEPIAITGMGCRFPDYASSPERFWSLLRNGVDAVSEIPAGRWDADAYFDPSPQTLGKMYTRWGGFLKEDITRFDTDFFHISPREAVSMDPQQRILLEVAWEALEHAGQAVDKLAGSPGGVFIGISANDYAQFTMFGDPMGIDLYTATGNALNAASGRLAYFLKLQGPALAVDTACSSSLVAVHLACQSLRNHECQIALAGGINLMLLPHATIATSRARMMSPDGRCKTFDAGANGYVRGEGCGLVVLKRLSDALADRDNILAIIRGSMVNQDGGSSALTVPNGAAQSALISRAFANAQVETSSLGYLETHGTGTALGDPIEIDSIKRALLSGENSPQSCALGSVKTNIGHLEAAAGIAGLIKVVLSLQHEEIPPHLHLTELNPQISLEGSPFFIPTEVRAWPRSEERRIAGVSSFGFSGTNAHLIVEEGPLAEESSDETERPLHVVTLSARSEGALKELAGSYVAHLKEKPEQKLGDIAFTANAGRSHFGHRVAMVVESREQLEERLSDFLEDRVTKEIVSGEISSGSRTRVAFLFTGQGSQYVGMGRELYQSSEVFRRALDQCAELAKKYQEESLLEVLYEEGGGSGKLDETGMAQPALFAVEYALSELWRSWGVEPGVVLGHSVGEYVAACVAGVFSLEDGMRLVAARGRLMQGLPRGGGMAAVFAGEELVREVIGKSGEEVSVAALNGPANTVISGELEGLERVVEQLGAAGVGSRMLKVSHAFHSTLMEPILDEFGQMAATVSYHKPKSRIISNLTGITADNKEITTADYWRRHVRKPVHFSQSVKTLAQLGCRVMLEIGPQPVLTQMGQSCVPDPTKHLWLSSLKKGKSDWQQILESLAVLYANGVDVEWEGVEREYGRWRVALPTYPFQRERYWQNNFDRHSLATPMLRKTDHPFLGNRRLSPLDQVEFESEFDLRALPWVDHHRIQRMAWVNLVVYLEAAFAAAREVFGSQACVVVKDLTLPRGLVLPPSGTRRVNLTLQRGPQNQAAFQVFSLAPAVEAAMKSVSKDSWMLHANGKVEVSSPEEVNNLAGSIALDEIQSRCNDEMESAHFYELMKQKGVELGPSIRCLDRIWRGDGEALCRLCVPDDHAEADPRLVLPMGVIDSCFQSLLTLQAYDMPSGYILTGLDLFQYQNCTADGSLWTHAEIVYQDEETETMVGNILLFDEAGRTLARVGSARLQRVSAKTADVDLSNSEDSRSAARVFISVEQVLAAEPEARREILVTYLLEELAQTLRRARSSLAPDVPLVEMLDSLTAVEIKSRIESNLNLEVPLAVFFEGTNISDLAAMLLDKVTIASEGAVNGELDDSVIAELLSELETMSEQDAQQMVKSSRTAQK